MKKQFFAIFAFLLLQMPLSAHAEHFQAVGTPDMYLSPHGGATTAVVSEIGAAKSKCIASKAAELSQQLQCAA